MHHAGAGRKIMGSPKKTWTAPRIEPRSLSAEELAKYFPQLTGEQRDHIIRQGSKKR
jgi:hypothetical protein